jgi:glycosyltransferase involved in cell wall biosynthesis
MKKLNKSIIYFGGAVPANIEEEVARVDIVPHMASQKFSWTVIQALSNEFDAVYNVSSCDIRNYPAGAKLAFSSQFFSRNGAQSFFVGFVNLMILKHVSRLLTLLALSPVIAIRQRARFMLVHGSHTPFMLTAILCKLTFRVRIAILLTDQHGRDVPSDGWAGRLFRALDSWLMRFLLQRFDAHICLSPAFVSKFGLRNVFVVPGILNENFKASVAANSKFKKSSEYFDIIFAGGVATENGVDRLVRAFGRIVDSRVRLFVFGAGPLVGDVESASRRDTRIHYGGVLHGEALTRALLAGSLLINPRPVGDEFAQTSFPSKLIEYMATGVPTLTTRLLGIPDEVRDFFYLIDGDSEESISQALINVMSIPPSERSTKGSMAAERVSSLYGEASFGRKVYELLR